MSEWIESHAAVPRKTKFRHLMRALGTSEVALVIGYLNALWYHGAECCPSGVLEGYTPEDVAEACYYQGDDPAKFTAALVKEHWLDKCPEGYEIHDWQDYNRQHRERQKAAQRQAAKRARERDLDDTSRDSHSDVTVTSRTTDRQTDRQTDIRKKRVPKKENPPSVEKSPKEIATLKALEALTEYPFDEVLDLEMLREPRDPRLDTAAEVLKFRDYWRPKWGAWKKKDPPNYRLAWRNWLEIAEQKCKARNGPLPASQVPFRPPDEELAATVEEVHAILAGRIPGVAQIGRPIT